MAELNQRLVQYAAICAAIPAASARADIVATTSLDLVISAGQSVMVDFGPGFGEVFGFEIRTGSFDRATSFYNALFHFNPDNSGGVVTGGFIAEQHSANSNLYTSNDPLRLPQGSIVSIGRVFYDPMTTISGTQHDIAGRFSSSPPRASGFGSWYPDTRGYIGFKMFRDGSFRFGWFDVETIGWNSLERSVGPQLIIHGWGFEDEVRIPIRTGEVPAPAAGGLLALAIGAAGIRRSRTLAAVG